MSELKEQLHLPKVGGELVAHFVPGIFIGATCEIPDRFAWEVRIVMLGPDSRYHPGRATIKSNEIPQFIEVISTAIQKIQSLKEILFSGEFSKKIDGSRNPMIEVTAVSGNIVANFWIYNDTTWRFSRVVEENELSEMVEILKTVECRGSKLIETLELIHG